MSLLEAVLVGFNQFFLVSEILGEFSLN